MKKTISFRVVTQSREVQVFNDRIRSLMFAIYFAISLALAGCASQSMETQAFKPGAIDLSKIEHNLVFIPVHIEPSQSNQKLSGMMLIEENTGHRYNFSFFRNFILGSQGIPYEKEGGKIMQNVLIDLPSGSYLIEVLDFAFLSETASQSFHHRMESPTRLIVDKHTYAGRVEIRFEEITLKGLFGVGERVVTFPMTREITKNTVEGMSAKISLKVSDRKSDDIYFMQDIYTGIEEIDFETRLLELTSE